MTTGQAARLLGCSRQHVVDLCTDGRLPYVSVGTHRRLHATDVQRLARRGLTRDQERSLWLHTAVAGHLVARPEEVLHQASRTLTRLEQDHSQGPVTGTLREWRERIGIGVPAVLEALVSPTPWAADLRQNSPFAGVLTQEERSTVLAAFRQDWRARAA